MTKSTPKEWATESVNLTSPSPFFDIKTETSRANGQTASLASRQTSIATIQEKPRTAQSSQIAPSKQKPRTAQASDDGRESPTTGARNFPSGTTLPPSATTRPMGDRSEISRDKGGAESYRKRLGVPDTSDDQPTARPHHAGKLCDAYDSIPLLEQTKLPRGGISIETRAVGRIQVSFSWVMDASLLDAMYEAQHDR